MSGMLAARTKKRCSPDRLSLPQFYMRQRWYDPTLQRFISRDKLMARNSYEYALSSPTNFVDITGLAPDTPTGGSEFGNSGIYRIPPGRDGVPIIHNNGGGYKPRKPQDVCWNLDWDFGPSDYDWPDYRFKPRNFDFGPVPDFKWYPPIQVTPIRWPWPDPDWRPAPSRPFPPTYPVDPVPPIFDPVGAVKDGIDDYNRNVRENDDMTNGDRRDIDDYNRRIREARNADPEHWRERWTRENGGPPIEPRPRQRVDI